MSKDMKRNFGILLISAGAFMIGVGMRDGFSQPMNIPGTIQWQDNMNFEMPKATSLCFTAGGKMGCIKFGGPEVTYTGEMPTTAEARALFEALHLACRKP